MFEQLLGLFRDGWAWIRPYFVVDAYELAAVLRFGRFHRERGPGIWWKIPFCEKPIEVTACETTVRLPQQAVTTKDDVQVTVACIVKYKIVKLEPYVTQIYDQHDVLCDVTMGAIRRQIAGCDYSALVGTLPEDAVATAVRRKTHKYGFEIVDITFTTFTRAKPLMLISPSVVRDLDN